MARLAAQTAVLLCAEPAERGGPALEQSLEPVLRRAFPLLPLAVVAGVCTGSPSARRVLASLGARRAVVACRHGRERRDEVVANLRRAGVHPAAIAVVDLAGSEPPDLRRAAVESLARIAAALALVSSADLSVVGGERIALGEVRLSRRGLLRCGTLARRPVVTWIARRCGEPRACRSCVAACPHGALSLAGSHVAVDAERCSGCGACLVACGTRALELNGTSVEGLERAASVLAAAARGLVPPGGVAIACAAAGPVPPGEGWLPLEVPSLEMVTAGWALQVLASGVAVTLRPCSDPSCRSRGRELLALCSRVLEALGVGSGAGGADLDGLALRVDACPGAGRAPGATAPCPAARRAPLRLELREPAATVRALSELAAPARPSAAPAGRATRGGAGGGSAARTAGGGSGGEVTGSWCVESELSPLGVVSVGSGRCSGCGSCALACPTGALALERAAAELALSFDGSACSACGACESSCPERCIVLRRAIDTASIGAGRHELARLPARCCTRCGAPVGAGLAAPIVSARLAGSHPRLAERLGGETRCAACLLSDARRPAESGAARSARCQTGGP